MDKSSKRLAFVILIDLEYFGLLSIGVLPGLKGAHDKVICTPDDISCWEECIASGIRSWGMPGGSLQLLRETLTEPALLLSDIPEEDLDLSEQNSKQSKRKICDGHYTAAVRVFSSSGIAPYNDDTLDDLKAKHFQACSFFATYTY
ncbi:hypothetical protein Tco_1493434 [Tanacetum coccineum]